MDRATLFLSIALPLRHLPNFRGKVRALLALYRLLGLEDHHIQVDTRLHRPSQYFARLDLHSAHERMGLLMNGYEAGTTRFLIRLFDHRGYLLDVGANVGFITLPFVSSISRSESSADERSVTPLVYCLEPIRSNCLALRTSARRNGFDSKIKILCVAAGEAESEAHIQVEGDLKAGRGTGTGNILPVGSSHRYERVPIRITTLDRLSESGKIGQECSLIKLDTDGYDLYALKGGRELLAAARPLILGEFSAHCLNWHGQTVQDVETYAKKLDYRLFVRHHPHWRFGPLLATSEFRQDLMLVPHERVREIDWCLA